MATTAADPLRNTLDHLRLDPQAREDRPYLVSMLRRLGYSEVEIRQYLGEPEPEPEAAPAAARPKRPSGPRVIEVEYTGPDFSMDYQRVGPGGAPPAPAGGRTRFAVGGGEAGEDGEDGFTLAEEQYEGTGEDFGDFDISAVDSAEGNWDDDWGEGGEFGSALDRREDEEELSESERKAIMEELGMDPEDDSIVEFGPRPTPMYEMPDEAPSTLLEFTEFTPTVAPSRMATEEDRARLTRGTFETEPADAEGGWSPSTWDGDEPPGETGQAGDQGQTGGAGQAGEPYSYKEYTLYRREVALSSGSSQTIYFFAKNPPEGADPSPLPDGYEVEENDKTGVPYLRRVYTPEPYEPEQTFESYGFEEPEPAPKRVRAVRVQATSLEEAEEMLRRQGKQVRGGVPIEYEDED